MTLQRIVMSFDDGEITARVLYRRRGEGPDPGTAARRREVTALVRTGLEQALLALGASDVEDLGTSGYSVREDTISVAKRSTA